MTRHAGLKHAAKKVTMGRCPLPGSHTQGLRRSCLIGQHVINPAPIGQRSVQSVQQSPTQSFGWSTPQQPVSDW